MKTWIIFAAIFSVLVFITCKKGSSKSDNNQTEVNLTEKVLTSNLNYPWEILWGPDNKLWITERGGKISKVDPATGTVTPLFTISEVVSQGEGGLLGMVLHPDFTTTPEVFVAY